MSSPAEDVRWFEFCPPALEARYPPAPHVRHDAETESSQRGTDSAGSGTALSRSVYIDTSTLAKRYLPEPGSEEFDDFLGRRSCVAISRGLEEGSSAAKRAAAFLSLYGPRVKNLET